MRPYGHRLPPSWELFLHAGQREKVLPSPGAGSGPWALRVGSTGQMGMHFQCRAEHFTPLKFLFVVPVLELQVLGHHIGFQLFLAVFLTILTSRVDPE